MTQTYTYTKQASCCGGFDVTVVRQVFVAPDAQHPRNVFHQKLNGNQELVDFKAMSRLSGSSRHYDVKVGIIGSHSRIGQAAQAAASIAIPGNLSPLRSPIRSGVWSAITPGLPGGGRSPSREGRSYRCPEGYQYGGRFTDNRLSTCGQKLFDIPSPLGATIAALRRAARGQGVVGEGVEGRNIGAGEYGDSPLQVRRPQISRVGQANPRVAAERVKQLAKDMGQPKITATRMVRRDGFILEPVVSAAVLRTIPDNRDMEGATYMSTLKKLSDLGGDELGLLSNTGVTSVSWVMPGGSVVSIDKARPLTVGERRKLGRTVNAAIAMDNRNDPMARLRYVATETGDGIKINERFVGIENPKENVTLGNGRTMPRWAAELYGKGKAPKKMATARRTESSAGSKISNLDEAIAHLNNGGSLASIAPSILQKVLANRALLKRDRNVVSGPDGRKFVVKPSRKDMEHINAVLSSDLQQALGLESPDVAMIGKGKRRSYLIEDATSTIIGGKPAPSKTIVDAEPADVASLLVSDFLTGNTNRKASTIELIESGDKIRAVSTDNASDLVDLDRIKIRDITRMRIEEMRSIAQDGTYGKYFDALREEQQRLFRRQLDLLIKRAARFNMKDFRQRMQSDGELSDAERTHLGIIARIFEQKLKRLTGSLDSVMNALGGEK